MSRLALAATMAATVLAAGCVAPTGPCLGAAPETVTLPFGRLESVSHEAEGGVELARFAFDQTVAGVVTVTASPADGPFFDAAFGEAIPDVQGDRQTSVTMDGLVGGAATDRLRADAINPHRIREIVQVKDPDLSRWVVGTVGGSCVRLRPNIDAAIVSLIVTDE